MKFSSFPRRQDIYLVYTSRETFRSLLFRNLCIQLSPKNSLPFRLLKTDLGFIIKWLFRHNISVPNEGSQYIGLIKKNCVIFFEFDKGEPKTVWRRRAGRWQREAFIGYQLISEYTAKEFENKYVLIENVLKKHWIAVNGNPRNIHGDFTHFNILLTKMGGVQLIDRKDHTHSKLFDFYYFYAYLRQCISRCVTLSKVEEKRIVDSLRDILRRVCKYRSHEEFLEDYENFNMPGTHGLLKGYGYQSEFYNIFEKIIRRKGFVSE